MKEKAKILPAIEIIFVKEYSKDFMKGRRPSVNKKVLHAKFHICKAEKTRNGFRKKKDSIIISNPEIRDAIENLEIRIGDIDGKFGNMKLLYKPRERVAIWTSYFPFESPYHEIFGGKGIERILEGKVRDRAESQFPGLKHFEHSMSMGQRRDQLEKRGHKNPERYSLGGDKILLRKQIAADTQKHRQARRERAQRTRPR